MYLCKCECITMARWKDQLLSQMLLSLIGLPGACVDSPSPLGLPGACTPLRAVRCLYPPQGCQVPVPPSGLPGACADSLSGADSHARLSSVVCSGAGQSLKDHHWSLERCCMSTFLTVLLESCRTSVHSSKPQTTPALRLLLLNFYGGL